MREIKFRGKSMGGHWIYGLLTKKKIRNSGKLQFAIAKDDFTLANTVPVAEDSIGQFTGVCDCNGKEIFEGDIIDHTGGRDYPLISVVKWFDEAAQWSLLNGRDHITFWPPFANSEYKVIGNIFDNPELLEGWIK